MLYGVENKDQARSNYTSIIRLKTLNIEVKKTEFWVYNLWPELGFTSDKHVTDPGPGSQTWSFGN